MVEKEMRNFALRDKDGNEIGVFAGKQPRQVQEAKERLWTVKNPCYACWQDQEYGWRGHNRFGETLY
jgi:hypothetical protein